MKLEQVESDGCEHHWHTVGSGIDHQRNERWTRLRCCHCGETEENRVPYGGGKSWSYTEKDCGPFKPDTRPWFI